MDDLTTETTAADTTAANPEAAAEAVVAGKMEEIFGGRTTPTQTQEETDELVQEGLLTEDGNSPADEQTIGAEVSDDTAPGKQKPEDAEPLKDGQDAGSQPSTLDPYLRFVGQQSGFTDERIDKLFKADPALAVDTLTTLADSYANLSRQYANPLGSPVAPGTQAVEQTPAPAATPTPKFDAFMSQLAAFSEANGEDMGKFATLVNEEIVGPLKAMVAANQVREADLLRQEATAGFEAVRGKFGDFYGPADGTLTEGQRQARSQVAAIADQIRAGAKAAGKSVSVKDAIARAHSVVTHDMRSMAARKELMGQVQKRTKAATVPPTQRRAKPAGERSDAAAEAAFREKAMELGLDDL